MKTYDLKKHLKREDLKEKIRLHMWANPLDGRDRIAKKFDVSVYCVRSIMQELCNLYDVAPLNENFAP